MEDDEFDLPDAEEYFPAPEVTSKVKAPAVLTQKLLEGLTGDEFDDDFEDGTAAQAVLGLPELLEHILLYVTPLEVYKLQRVNSFFKGVITGSIPLRRHMYFVPERYFVRNELNRLMNPRRGEESKLAKALHPFHFELYASSKGPGVGFGLSDHWLREEDKTSPGYLFRKFPEKYASWRTILINDSNAPLEVALRKYTIRGSRWRDPLRLTGQVTLGDLVAAAKRLTLSAWIDRYRRRLEEAEDRAIEHMFAICPEAFNDYSEEGEDEEEEEDQD